MTRVVIIGGSDAGMSAALQARELDATTDVTIVLADAFPNYSICGLPFYLSGEVPDWQQLAHRTAEEIARTGVRVQLNTTAQTIYPFHQTAAMVDRDGVRTVVRYDRLVIATGAVSAQPRIAGLDLPGVFPLRWMDDSFALDTYLRTHASQTAVIVGGGYIGVEMADALTRRGLAVTVVEHGASILKTVDPSLGQLVQAELERCGVSVITGVAIDVIEQAGRQLMVRGTPELTRSADLVLVAVGVRPRVDLAETAGIALGVGGAIRVTRAMETTVPPIFAAGDCVETWHRVLNQPTYLPLGTTAHKQGRVAGANAVGGRQEFAGSLGTQVVKVFDLAVARTGLRDAEARAIGFDPVTVALAPWDHKVYYPGAQRLHIRVTGDRHTGRLLGAQMVGPHTAEVAKRVDIFATALFHRMSVDALNDLDLSYTPPFSGPWDAVQLSAQAWVQAVQLASRRGSA
jgi:NADPH-dependent 2,4-dienoyl-CoA reductase/sulfur reductase-like enzyme